MQNSTQDLGDKGNGGKEPPAESQRVTALPKPSWVQNRRAGPEPWTLDITLHWDAKTGITNSASQSQVRGTLSLAAQ